MKCSNWCRKTSGMNKYYSYMYLAKNNQLYSFTFHSMVPQRKQICHKQYSEESVLDCIQAVKSGKTVYASCKEFGIPMSTIVYRMSGRWKNKHTPGPQSVLSNQEERRIVKWLEDMQDRGFPVSRHALLHKVSEYLSSNPRTTPFRDNRPGK